MISPEPVDAQSIGTDKWSVKTIRTWGVDNVRVYNSWGEGHVRDGEVSITRKTNRWSIVSILRMQDDIDRLLTYLVCELVGLLTQGRLSIGRLSKYLGRELMELVTQGRLTAGRLLAYLGCEPMGLVTQRRSTA
ncbi:hypothetical protein AMTR_s00015p00195290, partial [Amborella trichopoda]